MNTPKVAILIPAYNQPENLRVALQSIEMQTYEDYHVVIMDDTRDDRNYEVIKEFPDLSLTYHKNKWVFGSPANWNNAIRNSRSDYIKFLHHDDWFKYPDSLERYVAALDDNPDCDFAYSQSNGCNEKREVIYEHRPDITRLKYWGSLMRQNIIGAPSATIYRRSVGVEFDTRLRWLVDVDFYMRVLRKNPNVVFIESDLVNCLVSDKSVSHEYQTSCMKRATENLYLGLKTIGGI